MAIFFIIYLPLRWALAKPERYPTAHKLRVFWGKLLLFLGFIRVKNIFEVEIKNDRPYIIAPNHTSYIDIATVTSALDMLDFSFMAKAELLKIPLFGIWFKTIDIAVDRKNARKSAEAYIKAIRFFDSGRSLVIFPEGTISAQVPKMIKFKEGPFKMAIEKQIDIIPVSIIGNHKIFNDAGVITGGPGKVIQYIHKPVSTKGLTMEDLEALKMQVFDTINNKLLAHGY
jgi:1-acyl-sn-glycerol-3-phosphate acyltransferase